MAWGRALEDYMEAHQPSELLFNEPARHKAFVLIDNGAQRVVAKVVLVNVEPEGAPGVVDVLSKDGFVIRAALLRPYGWAIREKMR